MPSFQTTIELPIEVEYQYSGGQEPTRDEPGWAPEVDVQSAVIIGPALQMPARLLWRKLDRTERRKLESEAMSHARGEEAGTLLNAGLDYLEGAQRYPDDH